MADGAPPEPFHLKYRPRTFGELVGERQRITALSLEKMVELNRISQGLLFTGPSGTGKTSAARVLALALGIPPTDLQRFREIDAASASGKEDALQLVRTLAYSTPGRRIVILDEVHALTPDAFTVLLKTLEEPPEDTIFVLVTTEAHRVPETIASRLMEFKFRSISPEDILDRLITVAAAEQLTVDVDLLALIAAEARGAVRSALTELDKVALVGVRTAAAYRELRGDHDTAPELLAALLRGDDAATFDTMRRSLALVGDPNQIEVALVDLFTDLLVLFAGGSVLAAGEALERRRALVAATTVHQIREAFRVLAQQRHALRVSKSAESNLKVTLALLSTVFGGDGPPPAHLPSPPRTLHLADLEDDL